MVYNKTGRLGEVTGHDQMLASGRRNWTVNIVMETRPAFTLDQAQDLCMNMPEFHHYSTARDPTRPGVSIVEIFMQAMELPEGWPMLATNRAISHMCKRIRKAHQKGPTKDQMCEIYLKQLRFQHITGKVPHE